MPERQPEPTDPRVSVLISTFNRPQLLRRALSSIADSLGIDVRTDVEAIVVNDGGLDVSAVVGEFSDRLPIMLITSDVNLGRAAAGNVALRAARGAYVAFLDDDDVYLPGHLATTLRQLDSAPDLGAVYTYAIEVG